MTFVYASLVSFVPKNGRVSSSLYISFSYSFCWVLIDAEITCCAARDSLSDFGTTTSNIPSSVAPPKLISFTRSLLQLLLDFEADLSVTLRNNFVYSTCFFYLSSLSNISSLVDFRLSKGFCCVIMRSLKF